MNSEDIISEYKENFELDLKDDSYEKIVPVLPQFNSARFIHDFSAVCYIKIYINFCGVFIIGLFYFRMLLVLLMLKERDVLLCH